MRNNKHFAMCDSPIEPKINQDDLRAKIDDFLAKGGKIRLVPTGISNYEPLSVLRKNKGADDFEPGEM
jgi:hypothetical protein